MGYKCKCGSSLFSFYMTTRYRCLFDTETNNSEDADPVVSQDLEIWTCFMCGKRVKKSTILKAQNSKNMQS